MLYIFMSTEAITVQSQAYEVLERVVKARGTSGGVYLPVSWTGKRVKILLLDPVDEKEGRA
jgi:putative transposon-encoded protein